MLVAIIVLLSLILIVFGFIALGIYLNYKDSKEETDRAIETVEKYLGKHNGFLRDIYMLNSKILDCLSDIYYDKMEPTEKDKEKKK